MEWNRKISEKTDKTLGYAYFMDREHPLGDRKGRVWLHRHVASMKLGRWLSQKEVVHHIDGDRANNDPDNLVVTTRSAHVRLHLACPDGRKKKKCGSCGQEFVPTSDKIKSCSVVCGCLLRRKFNPSKEELEQAVQSEPMVRVAKRYGVSDNAVRKRCRKLDIRW